jgi:hypothetical protein
VLILLLIVVLIVLSLMFGGFQKGTKSSGLAPLCSACVSATTYACAADKGAS